MNKSYSKHLIFSDVHIPFHNEQGLEAIINFSKDLKPDVIVINGDLVDFDQISKFPKDVKRMSEFQNDLDTAYKYLKKLRQYNPKAKFVYSQDNHCEDRLNTLKKEIPSLSSLKSLTLEEMLHFKEFDIEKKTYQNPYVYKDYFVILHGTICRKNGGASAKATLEQTGKSGVMGHVHKLNSYSNTDMNGIKTFIEGGHVCDPKKMDYVKGVSNWQSGFVVAYLGKDNNDFWCDIIPIKNDKFIYQGKQY